MNQQKSLIRISELLSRFKIQTSILNNNAQLDINIIAEDILIPIFNILYNCNLKNAKYIEDDAKFPALDLLDPIDRIAFQITSTPTMKKVRKTLDGIVKNKFYDNFDLFYIYIITQKQRSYDKNVLINSCQNKFVFTEKNILDEKDLFKKVASLSYEKIVLVEKLLESQFSDIHRTENNIQTELKDLARRVSELNEKHIALELDGTIKVREKWLEKKLFFEEKLPLISDVNQEFNLICKINEINNKINNCNTQIAELLDQSKMV